MNMKRLTIMMLITGSFIFLNCADRLMAQDTATPTEQGKMPMSSEPDTYQRDERRLFPLMTDKMRSNIKKSGRELPPPFGVMYVTNWMDSDWKFTSAAVTLGNSPYINLDAAKDATMDLQVQSNGVKADLWLFPFLDLMAGGGKVDIDAQLGLRNIPVGVVPGLGGPTTVRGDKIIPMKFGGDYYSFGGVLAGAYQRLYGACDFSWVKTKLQGNASLSADGFWTFTAAPKIGYNAGLSQIYIGARYISKNEHYKGTVGLPDGNNLGFDVFIKTDSWVGNFGLRTVIRKHWEILMESAIGKRYQITGGVGYRW
jgi:hypothetical protein